MRIVRRQRAGCGRERRYTGQSVSLPAALVDVADRLTVDVVRALSMVAMRAEIANQPRLQLDHDVHGARREELEQFGDTFDYVTAAALNRHLSQRPAKRRGRRV